MRKSVVWLALLIGIPSTLLSARSDSGWVRVVTEPEGAPIYLGGRFVGTSPVDSVSWPAGRTVVQAQRGPRYLWSALAVAETVNVVPGELTEVRLLLPASPMNADRPEDGPVPAVMRGPGELGVSSETWMITSGAAMVASGVLAAVFRDKANKAAARYLETRDPGALNDVRRYDRMAGAAMIGVQVSLGAFFLFLTGH